MPAEPMIGADAARQTTLRHACAAWVPFIVFPALVIAFRSQLVPWVFMWLLAVTIFGGLKWQTWWAARVVVIHPPWRSLAYLLAWPGMDAEAFLDAQQKSVEPEFQEWVWASAKTLIGIVLLWVVARQAAMPLLKGWIGLLGLVLLLHFGFFHLVALFWQSRGVAAKPIMAKPILSRTLSEFWGKRWNLGFRQLAYDLVFQPLHKRIGVAGASLLVFLASGLIHDLVISLPAHGGYGLPTGYFVLQGLGVTVERSSMGRRLGLQHGFTGWLFMLVFTAGPAFWLFHPFFVTRVILPFMHAIGAL
jgi:Membrane bound O-acyl transferase family